MIENRDYMRSEPSSGGSWRFHYSATVVLMVVLVVIFALQCINDVYFQTVIEGLLALTPYSLTKGFVWQFITFQFFHVNLTHLICNLVGLWFFARPVEDILGTKRFLVAYFGCGVLGGLLQAVLMVLFPNHFVPFVFGASAGVMGVFAIFCRLQSEAELRWNFLIPIRADILLWIFAAISLFFTLVPSGRGGMVAHAAHLGGILGGLAWIKLGWHRDFATLPWENLWQRWRFWLPTKSRERKRELVRAASVRRRPWQTANPDDPAELPAEEFISQEVDPILDKISAHGIQSLTDRERKILEAARKKMGRR